MVLTRRLCRSLKKCPHEPTMIVDALSMYTAKATGLAAEFDVFIPGFCEMGYFHTNLFFKRNLTFPCYLLWYYFSKKRTTEGYHMSELARFGVSLEKKLLRRSFMK